MTPRRYSMDKRKEAIEQTRRRILDATMSYHFENGIYPTSFEELAGRAEVSVATIYRHFPDLDTLVGACGADFFALVDWPAPGSIDYGRATDPQARLRILVERLCRSYKKGEPGFRNMHGEAHLVRTLAEVKVQSNAAIKDLVREAIGDGPRVAAVAAVVDFPVWASLKNHGMPAHALPDAIAHLAGCAHSAKPANRR